MKKENKASTLTERLAQACAKSCITSSSLLGGFGPGEGRNREGYRYLLFGWFGCAGIHFRCAGVFEFFPSQRSRCGYQKVLKVVPVGYGRTVIGNGMKLQLELLNLEVTYVSNSRYLYLRWNSLCSHNDININQSCYMLFITNMNMC